MSQIQAENFVTVVAVGTDQQDSSKENINFDSNGSGYVTVLTIGDNENSKVLKDATEEVIVYRLPGERLGFGLKFEGGTKASECVKRLFIQSCAEDSPASRVKSSWGKLSEGDEVLQIDSVPVSTLTRIDCVRCLKDSNVAIKLLVRHIYHQPSKSKPEVDVTDTGNDGRRTPPPPPPVPPRKIPRRLSKNSNAAPKEPPDNTHENTPRPEQIKTKKLRSSRSSMGPYSSPDASRRDSLGPPDAEVYVDLFLQESAQSLSESDDTGSTISTVIDKFGSIPTTTTSSFSGSLPSTPTSLQRQLDISNINIYDDDDPNLTNKHLEKNLLIPREENNNIIIDESNPLCFQDAPLSYGDENTKVIVPEGEDVGEELIVKEDSRQTMRKPPVPPRSKDTILSSVEKNDDSKKFIGNLPRLVDFVPKSSNGIKENIETSADIMKLFLENERSKADIIDYDCHESDNVNNYTNGIDLYASKWSISQLATIGEVEEEGSLDSSLNRPTEKSPPMVIVENTDLSEEIEKLDSEDVVDEKESHGTMASPPSDSRQPPDGHEFPDFIEDPIEHSKQRYFQEANIRKSGTAAKYNQLAMQTSLEDIPKTSNLLLCQQVSASNNDIYPELYDSTEDFNNSEPIPEPSKLHIRSQSLVDMTSISKQKNNKWNQLIEQRKKGLSKLKGLVIPENIESDISTSVNIPVIKSQDTTVNIPEFKSRNADMFIHVPKLDNNAESADVIMRNRREISRSSLAALPWASDSPSSFPKYSPAFKRKSLQVYPANISKSESEYQTTVEFPKYCDKPSYKISKMSDDDLHPPKSLESISSPTRSDCSFDYVNSTRRYTRELDSYAKPSTNKTEDESDNDSAVSSSQSSYNSRYSPPPSPNRSCDLENFSKKEEDDDDANAQNRLLKRSSVEAINRKNILASAKCRSGKDLKIGSPVIRRRQEETADGKEVDNKGDAAMEVAITESVVSERVINNTAVKNESPKDEEVTTRRLVSKNTDVIKNISSDSVVVDKSKSLQKPYSRSTSLPVSPLSRTVLTRSSEPPKEPRLPRDFFSNRKSVPINVKALKENFESFGSTPSLASPKTITTPSRYQPVPSRNIRAEIAEKEIKIALDIEKDVAVKKTEKPPQAAVRDVKPRLESTVVPAEKLPGTTSVSLKSELGIGLGITLSGGADEDKELTVYRIKYASPAYQDGRLKRGDKVLSVNGKTTKGLTHSEAVDLLKEAVTDFVIVIEGVNDVPSLTSAAPLQKRSVSMSVLTDIKTSSIDVEERTANFIIKIQKESAGLGFSIEGGKDSPQGDVPLVVRKVFTGGPADKSGELKVGDQIIQINEVKLTNLTRIEAWNLMKKIPDGQVFVHIYR